MLVGITDERFGTVQRHTFQHDFLAHISNNTTLRAIWKKESCDSSPRLKAGAPSQQNGGERAIDRIRTGDLRITRALLCQLSYDGETVPA